MKHATTYSRSRGISAAVGIGVACAAIILPAGACRTAPPTPQTDPPPSRSTEPATTEPPPSASDAEPAAPPSAPSDGEDVAGAGADADFPVVRVELTGLTDANQAERIRNGLSRRPGTGRVTVTSWSERDGRAAIELSPHPHVRDMLEHYLTTTPYTALDVAANNDGMDAGVIQGASRPVVELHVEGVASEDGFRALGDALRRLPGVVYALPRRTSPQCGCVDLEILCVSDEVRAGLPAALAGVPGLTVAPNARTERSTYLDARASVPPNAAGEWVQLALHVEGVSNFVHAARMVRWMSEQAGVCDAALLQWNAADQRAEYALSCTPEAINAAGAWTDRSGQGLFEIMETSPDGRTITARPR